MIATWVVLMRVARRWAVPGALAVAAIAIAVDPREATAPVEVLPALTFTAPTFDAGALLGLALPLFVVTMASQNVTGIAVLQSFGYRPPITPGAREHRRRDRRGRAVRRPRDQPRRDHRGARRRAGRRIPTRRGAGSRPSPAAPPTSSSASPPGWRPRWSPSRRRC